MLFEGRCLRWSGRWWGRACPIRKLPNADREYPRSIAGSMAPRGAVTGGWCLLTRAHLWTFGRRSSRRLTSAGRAFAAPYLP
jgi:hypothetical protein